MRKYWYRRSCLCCLCYLSLVMQDMKLQSGRNRGEKKEVSADTVSSDTVIPGGMPVGIYLETEGSWS